MYVIHYFNQRTRSLACGQHISGLTMSGRGCARMFESDKEKVTCKRCLVKIARWKEDENKGEWKNEILSVEN